MKAYKYRVGIGVKNEKGKFLFDRDIQSLSKNEIYASPIDKLNDPTEGVFNCKDFIENQSQKSIKNIEDLNFLAEIFSNSGIFSLSKNIKNELLWAYYASGHTGYAIEYDIDILKDCFNFVKGCELAHDFDVKYEKNTPKIPLNLLDKENLYEFFKIFIGTKSKAWKHEKERRLLFNCSGLKEYDYRAVTGIYFGFKIENREMNIIMNLLQGRKIKYYKMCFVENSYELYPIPIKDLYDNAPIYDWGYAKNINPYYLSKEYLKENYRFLRKIKNKIDEVKKSNLIVKIDSLDVQFKKGDIILVISCTYKNQYKPYRKYKFTLRKLNDKILDNLDDGNFDTIDDDFFDIY